MIVTEAEAKEKVCPQQLAADRRIANRCVGSACMAWREYDGGGYCGVSSMPAKVAHDLQAVQRIELVKAQREEREAAQAAFFAMSQPQRGPAS